MERDYQDSDFKEDKDNGLGICRVCNNTYYPETEYVSHGCLGQEPVTVIRCSCDDERERSEGPAPRETSIILPEDLENDMPF